MTLSLGRTDLRQAMQDTFGSRAFRERGLFNVDGVQLCVARHLAGTHDYSEPLWLLLTYETWARRFLDAEPVSAGTALAA